jgi:hypothetical protein
MGIWICPNGVNRYVNDFFDADATRVVATSGGYHGFQGEPS